MFSIKLIGVINMKIHTGYSSKKATKNYQKIYNFVQTKKGKEFVSALHSAPLKELAKRFNIPSAITFKNDTKNYKLIQKACIHGNVIVVKTRTYPAVKPNIINYTHTSIPKPLTKQQLRAIDKAKPKIPWARILHNLEETRMKKWDKKHPGPSEKELKENLFPEQLRQWHIDDREKQQENVRNLIILRHYKDYVPIYGRFKLFDNTYKECIIGFVKDTKKQLQQLGPCGDIEPQPIELIRKAYEIVNETYKNNPNLICGKIHGKRSNIGRVILPGADKKYQIAIDIHQLGNLRIAA